MAGTTLGAGDKVAAAAGDVEGGSPDGAAPTAPVHADSTRTDTAKVLRSTFSLVFLGWLIVGRAYEAPPAMVGVSARRLITSTEQKRRIATAGTAQLAGNDDEFGCSP